MAYYIPTNINDLSFTKTCPYCDTREADTNRNVKHKEYTRTIGVAASYILREIDIPICNQCSKKNKILLGVAFTSLVMFFLFPIIGMTIPTFDAMSGWGSGVAICTFLVTIMWRNSNFSKLQLSHIVEDIYTFRSRNKKVANEFAELNNSVAKWKLFNFRIK